MREHYAGKDDGVTLEVGAAPATEEVFETEQAKQLIGYVLGSKDGVNTMSAEVKGLVESLCNMSMAF